MQQVLRPTDRLTSLLPTIQEQHLTDAHSRPRYVPYNKIDYLNINIVVMITKSCIRFDESKDVTQQSMDLKEQLVLEIFGKVLNF